MELVFDFLELGMKIKIQKLDNKDEGIYSSQVIDILDMEIIEISGPIKKSNLISIYKGDEIKVIYNVKDRGNHFFKAEVISRRYLPVYSLRIKRISNIEKTQLRKYYRLSIMLNLEKEHCIIEDYEAIILKETCELKDISGGGMQLYCNYEHNIGDKIYCSMKIRRSTIRFKGTIVRINEIDSFNYKFSLGVSFTDIEEDDRDKIIKFIFEQQRILRLKGLI